MSLDSFGCSSYDWVLSGDRSAYDFHLVERFLTYALNTIGQNYLRTCVNVYLSGDPEQLHPNLRNTLTNLCKRVQQIR